MAERHDLSLSHDRRRRSIWGGRTDTANRLKVLVHDGFGVWLAARRLNQGKFAWGDERLGPRLTLSVKQLQALVTGLPWQRLGQDAVITVL